MQEDLWSEPERVIRVPTPFEVLHGSDVRVVTRVELTGFDGWVEDALANTSGNKQQQAERFTEVLSRCTVRAGDDDSWFLERPQGQTRKSLPKFFSALYEEMPLANRTLQILRLRQLAVHDPDEKISGHKFTFDMTCPHCKKLTQGYYHMLNEVEVRYSSKVVKLNHVEYLERGGSTYAWRPLRGKDAASVSHIMEDDSDSRPSRMLKLLLVSIDGAPVESLSAVKDLRTQDRAAILRASDSFGSVDTSIILPCRKPTCGREYTTRIPTDQKSFFSPEPESN